MAERPSSALSTAPTLRRPDWAPRFIEVFSATGNVRLAATAAGVSRDAPYKKAQASSAFAAQWLQAREDAVDILEGEARRRALTSSDAILMFLLRAQRPDLYRDKVALAIDVGHIAAGIAATLGIEPGAIIEEAERILAKNGP
jgi:hypothetical protein